MKKIYLLEVIQNETKSYVGSASARDLVRLATKEEFNELCRESLLKHSLSGLINNMQKNDEENEENKIENEGDGNYINEG